MKMKIFTIAIASVATILFFAGCSARKNVPPPEAMTDEGIVINGVRWATRNAEWHRASSSRVLRTFASSPEMPGTFFAPSSEMLIPCPPGWRLPSIPEFESLVAAGSVWTAVNGEYGRLFGTAPNQLFLPAAGKNVAVYRERGSNYVNEKGYYSVGVPRRTISPEGEEILLLCATPPRMAMIFCQENIGIYPMRSSIIEARSPRSREPGDPTIVFLTMAISPELSVRCVAITD